MRKFQINEKHRELIESVIKESPKYKGNEDLIEIFCEAIYKKSYLLIDAIKDMSRLRRHLLGICDSCIDAVLKEKQKFDEIKIYKQIEQKNKDLKEIVSLKENVLSNEDDEDDLILKKNTQKSIIDIKEETKKNEQYEGIDALIDPIEFCPKKKVQKDDLDKLIKDIKKIDSANPSKRYLEIFTLRYIKNLNQNDIAKIIKISQVELSKRLVELVGLLYENN